MISGDYQGKILFNRILSGSVREIGLKLERPMDWLPGQYISCEVGRLGARRSYSISNVPNSLGLVELCVDLAPEGVGSRAVERWRPGDRVKFKGPLGKFVIEDSLEQAEKRQCLVFVATGVGIAPIKPMIAAFFGKGKMEKRDSGMRKVVLFWGLRIKEGIYYRDYWKKLAAGENFEFKIILSKPNGKWDGQSGYVTGYVSDWARENGHRVNSYYLCGNMGMINDVRRELVLAGVEMKAIHFESFYSEEK